MFLFSRRLLAPTLAGALLLAACGSQPEEAPPQEDAQSRPGPSEYLGAPPGYPGAPPGYPGGPYPPPGEPAPTPAPTLPQVDFEPAWAANFPGGISTLVSEVRALPDGGAVFCGIQERAGDLPDQGEYRGWLVRIDGEGKTVWEREFDEPALALALHPDGGVAMAGGYGDTFIRRVSPEGEELWMERYPGARGPEKPMWDEARALEICRDGGFILVGATQPAGSSGAAARRLWLMRAEADGTYIGEVVLEEPTVSEARDVRVLGDDSFVVAANFRPAPGMSDPCILRFDPKGREIWRKYFGDPNVPEQIATLRVAENGEMYGLATMHPESDAPSVLFVRFNAAGDALHGNAIPGGIGRDVVRMPDSSYLALALKVSPAAFGSRTLRHDVWLMRLDAGGRTLWSPPAFDSANVTNDAHSLAVYPDGAFVLAGTSRKQAAETENAFAVKFAPKGDAAPEASATPDQGLPPAPVPVEEAGAAADTTAEN